MSFNKVMLILLITVGGLICINSMLTKTMTSLHREERELGLASSALQEDGGKSISHQSHSTIRHIYYGNNIMLDLSNRTIKGPVVIDLDNVDETKPNHKVDRLIPILLESNNKSVTTQGDYKPSLITKYGYPVEVHTLTTSDGYILEAHRIPFGRGQSGPLDKPPVLVMHGLLSSSADFVLMGPRNALAYKLADAGYDVWLLNARGNFYSRNHISLTPDDRDFWRFSWDDIGNIDLPTYIGHVILTTGQPKVHYIGHSQGGTSFLVLMSLRPEYNERILSFQGLAPASFFTYNENPFFNTLATYENVLESTAFALGFAEIFGNNQFTTWFIENHCSDDSLFQSLCDRIVSELFDNEYQNSTMIPVIIGHTPAGASVRQIAHYGQVIKFDQFRRYNYLLTEQNVLAYGRTTPPEYDLAKVIAPAYLYYGLADNEVDYRDLLKLASILPNVVRVYKVERESFNHFDFLFSIDAPELIYEPVIDAMKHAEEKFASK